MECVRQAVFRATPLSRLPLSVTSEFGVRSSAFRVRRSTFDVRPGLVGRGPRTRRVVCVVRKAVPRGIPLVTALQTVYPTIFMPLSVNTNESHPCPQNSNGNSNLTSEPRECRLKPVLRTVSYTERGVCSAAFRLSQVKFRIAGIRMAALGNRLVTGGASFVRMACGASGSAGALARPAKVRARPAAAKRGTTACGRSCRQHGCGRGRPRSQSCDTLSSETRPSRIPLSTDYLLLTLDS